MWPAAERQAGCASELQLVQRQTGELDGESLAAITAHLVSCPRCQRLAAELDQERAAFATRPMPIALAPKRRPRGAMLATAATATVVAAAAIALLFVRTTPTPEGTRLKGAGATATIYVEHRGVVRALERGQSVAPGDRLRLVVRSPKPTHVALLAVDGAGQAGAYLPTNGTSTVLVPSGDVPVPGAAELDDVVGDERLFVLTCATAVPLAGIVASLPQPTLPDGCSIEVVEVKKRPVMVP